MKAQKLARWTSKRIGGATPTIRHLLRAGRLGTGQELAGYFEWDTPRGQEEGDRVEAKIERWVRAEGYRIYNYDLDAFV